MRFCRKFPADIPKRGQASSIGPFRWAKRLGRKSLAFAQPVGSAAYTPVADVDEKLTTRHLLNPILWFKWSTTFALNWLLSRPYSNALATIPAITLGTALVTVIIFSTSDHPQSRANRYRTIFDDSVKGRDFDVASVVLKSLIDSSPQNLELQYQQALIKHMRGDTGLAVKQMGALVTLKNHGLAAMWMISQEFNLQELKKWSDSDHARFRQLIEIGLKNLEGENLLSAKATDDCVTTRAECSSHSQQLGSRRRRTKRRRPRESSIVGRYRAYETTQPCLFFGNSRSDPRKAESLAGSDIRSRSGA